MTAKISGYFYYTCKGARLAYGSCLQNIPSGRARRRCVVVVVAVAQREKIDLFEVPTPSLRLQSLRPKILNRGGCVEQLSAREHYIRRES